MSDGTILSGHQPSFYHPGILAKRLLIDARMQDGASGCAWLVADQDVNEPGLIQFPDLDEHDRLIRRTWHAVAPRPGVPTCMRSVDRIAPPPRVSRKLPPSIQEGLDSMHEALEDAGGATVSERFAEANEALLRRLVDTPCRMLHASRLSETEHGRAILERIVEDPIGCAECWNEAIRAVPRSARPLHIDQEDPNAIEVPTWSVDGDTGLRRKGTLGELRRALAEQEPILPRAFLMTAIVRSSGFETMVHGTGGGRYEVVTNQWAARFLGIELPPIVMTTATVLLPLEAFAPAEQDLPTPEQVRALEHDPWPETGHKQVLVEAIRNAPRGSDERRTRYLDLQSERARQQDLIGSRLLEMKAGVEAGREALAGRLVGEERSWAWPLHDIETLREALTNGFDDAA